MIFIPIFFFGSTGSSDGPLVTEGRHFKLRNFLVLASLVLSLLCTVILLAVTFMDSVFSVLAAPAATFLGSLLPHNSAFGFLAVLVVTLTVPMVVSFAVSRRDNFIVTALSVATVAVWATMAITAFLPVGVPQ